MKTRKRVARARTDLRGEAQHCEVVGSDSIRQARGQPQQRALFRGSDPTFLHAVHFGERALAAYLQQHAWVHLLAELGHGSC